jgi:predicted O-methyltransferase YrrM
MNLNNIKAEVTEFSAYLKTFDFRLSTFDLIYFDGNHSKKATLDYFEMLLPTINNQSVWIFDDIHWSKDMEEAWEIIKTHSKVTVTIDTFQWGMVFFRYEQPKEHFVIRA